MASHFIMDLSNADTTKMTSYSCVSLVDYPIPYKNIEEANSDLIEKPPEEYDGLITTLPLEPFFERPFSFSQPFRFFPKSGTTWLKAMIFATLTRNNYLLDQHPLHTHNPHQCVPYMELGFATGRSQIIEVIPSPRVMSTHLPYSLLPDSITESSCQIVYVWRDPKDVMVSMWYFVQKVLGGADKVATFDQFYEFFYQGLNSFGPIWNHVLGYWEESKERPEKFLFLKYEHILQEPVKCAKQLAHFIGCPYSENEENQGVVEQIVELCSIKKLKDFDVNKDNDRATSKSDVHISNAYYFR
ncbi:hypothetical protein LUZ61_014249 [Rhynchospora tenuis]|uniref:Sulfotransferase n=1 Tax=Rhynchospora tenuis TaxID=198213 RepID=A0AAD5Z0Z8_9POAL|nr:hypothetical protein LUZ61_014249 [Rhynchospora tenuis]